MGGGGGGGAAGPPLAQQNGVRLGCPLSPTYPTLFGIFFDDLHAHLDQAAPHAGVQLGSGRGVSSLGYADDVILMSGSAVRHSSKAGHMLLECHALAGLRLQWSALLLSCSSVMRRLIWAKDQHEVCRYIIALP